MGNNLHSVTRNLRELIKTLPAVKANCSAEVIKRHLQLIAHFQKQYDQLVSVNSPIAHA
ncbi:MAG: hypothetical protein AB8B84_02255 [Granulosicoccus sp.]